jgi:hypothetical protein
LGQVVDLSSDSGMVGPQARFSDGPRTAITMIPLPQGDIDSPARVTIGIFIKALVNTANTVSFAGRAPLFDGEAAVPAAAIADAQESIPPAGG